MLSLSPSLLPILLIVRLVLSQTSVLKLHEAVTAVPDGWTYVGPANDSIIVNLSIALKQPGLDGLRARLDAISNPNHQDFGAHLSKDQLLLFQQPQLSSINSVSNWLESHDIDNFQHKGAWIYFNATVQSVNSLLRCHLARYADSKSQIVYRALNYSLPIDLSKDIDFVFPVTQLIRQPKHGVISSAEVHQAVQRRQTELPRSCWNYVTPDCIVDMYNITYIVPDGISASRLGIAGFLEQYPNAEAVHNFLAKHSPRRNASDFSPSYNFTVEAINGGNDTDTGFGVEAILDTEYTMAFTQPLNITYYSTAGRGPDTGTNGTEVGPENTLDEPWIEFLEHMLTKDDASLPQVLSISYTDNEQQIPRPYATRVCDLFMQLTSRGVSVLIASGDGGAAGAGRQECYANDGTQQKVKFIPTFPVGCPYITSVGSTGNYFPTEPSSFSSGGFSDYFARPAWQEDAAHAYIKSLNGSHDGFYNASGRGIPDVSAVGSRFLVAAGGFEWQQSGTSASTPVWAAIIALINDKRLRAGKPVLGFLNPILYSADVSAAFKDVVQGFSASCTWGSNVESGWEAKSGWDPATGLGTPNFQRLLEILG